MKWKRQFEVRYPVLRIFLINFHNKHKSSSGTDQCYFTKIIQHHNSLQLQCLKSPQFETSTFTGGVQSFNFIISHWILKRWEICLWSTHSILIQNPIIPSIFEISFSVYILFSMNLYWIKENWYELRWNLDNALLGSNM